MESVINGVIEWIMSGLIQLFLKPGESSWSKLKDDSSAAGLAAPN